MIAHVLHKAERHILVGEQQHTRSGIGQGECFATEVTEGLLQGEFNAIERLGIEIL